LAWRVSQRASRERYFSKTASPYQVSDQALTAHTRSRGAIFDPFTSPVDEVLNRHSPDPGGFEARIAPLNGLGNRKSRSLRAKGDRSGRLAAPKRCARRTSGPRRDQRRRQLRVDQFPASIDGAAVHGCSTLPRRPCCRGACQRASSIRRLERPRLPRRLRAGARRAGGGRPRYGRGAARNAPGSGGALAGCCRRCGKADCLRRDQRDRQSASLWCVGLAPVFPVTRRAVTTESALMCVNARISLFVSFLRRRAEGYLLECFRSRVFRPAVPSRW